MLGAFADDAVLRDFAKRLNRRDERGAELVAKLVEQMQLKAAGLFVDQLTPVREFGLRTASDRASRQFARDRKAAGFRAEEPFTADWIERSIKPGDVLYDVGANVGPYSLIAAKATSNGARIFAFEPSAPSFHGLSRNILINDCREHRSSPTRTLVREPAALIHVPLTRSRGVHTSGQQRCAIAQAADREDDHRRPPR